MNNIRVGRIGATITGVAVLTFAISMLIDFFTDTIFFSCLSSLFIAIGYIIFIAGILSSQKNGPMPATAVAGIAFAVVYAVLIFLVYYAECTTVRMNTALSEEAISIISYSHLGSLFFNYDLLGYAFMGLSTFFVGFSIKPIDNSGKWLQRLLWIHGIFFIACLIVPMLPIFKPGTDSIVGTILLEFWCVYFIPVCILGWKYIGAEEH